MKKEDRFSPQRIANPTGISLHVLALAAMLLFSCTPASDLFLDIQELVFPPPFPGDLDTTFGNGDGIVTTSIGIAASGYTLGIQMDGKILVAGESAIATDYDIALVRYTSVGDLDTTFGGGDGIVTTPIGSGDELGVSIGIQADGKILVAGYTYNGVDFDFALVRYISTGDLDTSFGGGDGIVTTPIGSGGDYGRALGIQTDGKILFAGTARIGTNDDFALVRYTSVGDLDTTFGGGDGIVTTPIGSSRDFGNDLEIQPDGKILVAGTASSGTNDDIALVRYTSVGDLDATFGGGDGIVTTPIGSGSAGWKLGIQADGKILVAGTASSGTNDDFALVRYTSVGDLDTTFGGGDGIVTTPIGSGHNEVWGLGIQADRKILVAGTTSNGTNDDFALVRYSSVGDLDTTFGGGDGVVTTPIGSGNDEGWELVIQADGKILVAGTTKNGMSDFALVRYHP